MMNLFSKEWIVQPKLHYYWTDRHIIDTPIANIILRIQIWTILRNVYMIYGLLLDGKLYKTSISYIL